MPNALAIDIMTPREVAMRMEIRARAIPVILTIKRRLEKRFFFFTNFPIGYRIKGVVIAAIPAT